MWIRARATNHDTLINTSTITHMEPRGNETVVHFGGTSLPLAIPLDDLLEVLVEQASPVYNVAVAVTPKVEPRISAL